MTPCEKIKTTLKIHISSKFYGYFLLLHRALRHCFFFFSNTVLLTKWNTNPVEFLSHFKVQSHIKLNFVIYCLEQRFGLWMGMKNLSPARYHSLFSIITQP